MSSPIEEKDPAPAGTGRNTVARAVVTSLVVVIVVGLALAVVLVVKDRSPSSGGSTAQSSVSTTDEPPSATPTPGQAALAMDPAAVAAHIDPGVVELTIKRSGGAVSQGTGVVATASGEFLTNDHVVNGATSIMGTVGGGGATQTFTATVIGNDQRRDIALLQLQGASGLQTPTFAPTTTVVSPGEPVIDVGHSRTPGAAPALIPGIVLGLDQRVPTNGSLRTPGTRRSPAPSVTSQVRSLRGLIQLYASTLVADNGSPVINSAGQVIGINVASAGPKGQSSVPVAYAIPIETALQAAEQIRNGTVGQGQGPRGG